MGTRRRHYECSLEHHSLVLVRDAPDLPQPEATHGDDLFLLRNVRNLPYVETRLVVGHEDVALRSHLPLDGLEHEVGHVARERADEAFGVVDDGAEDVDEGIEECGRCCVGNGDVVPRVGGHRVRVSEGRGAPTRDLGLRFCKEENEWGSGIGGEKRQLMVKDEL